jgi:hypothetical protein
LGGRKLPFSYVSVSRTFWTIKKSKEKYMIIFSPREGPWAKQARKGSHEGQMSPCGAAYLAGRATMAHLSLEHRLGSSFLQMAPSRHKT